MIIYVYVEKNTNKNDLDSEDEEVVSYTLIPSNNKNERTDGYGQRCWSPDYFHAQHYKTVRKAKVRNMLEEQLDNLDDFVL